MYPTTTTIITRICLAAGLVSTVTAGPTPPGSGGPWLGHNFNQTGAPAPGPPQSPNDTLPTVASPSPAAGLVQSRAAVFNASTATLDEFAANALEVAKSRLASNSSSTCTAENVTVRKLWFVFSPSPVLPSPLCDFENREKNKR